MSTQNPDRWLVVKVQPVDETLDAHYRVFATWGGGYLQGQSWKINSGIESVTEDENYFYFLSASGSTYGCLKGSYGITGYGLGILNGLIEQSKNEVTITQMPKETDWVKLFHKE